MRGWPRVQAELEAPVVVSPRARGDGPVCKIERLPDLYCSPRTRGWPPRLRQVWKARVLLPADAGMDPYPW
ncbi:hypothetical protein ACIRPH_00205 [Nocardiopsis sp. NPDC101807]|uniref:hypothetical protein n=1 Tax=Nocardiopsis sp. NPDC101807 TaxID=3364339 RepID=UPI0038214802